MTKSTVPTYLPTIGAGKLFSKNELNRAVIQNQIQSLNQDQNPSRT